MNTHKHGEISLVILYDSKKDEFVGFCYEFAIVKYGDDFLQLKKDLIEASKGYLKAVLKTNGSKKLLNQSDTLPKDFRLLYEAIRQDQNSDHARAKLPRSIADTFKSGDAFLVPACI